MSETGSVQMALKHLVIYTASGAALSCQHCRPNGTGRLGRGGFLPLETIRRAVGEALPLGLQSVRLSGASTLLHPEINALLDWLESLELAVSIETNGAGMTRTLALRLARIPQISAAVGLNGTSGALACADSASSAGAASPSGADSGLLAARQLAAAGLAPQLVVLLTRRNAWELGAAVRQAEEIGAESLRFVAARPALAAINNTGSLRQPASWSTNLLTVEELIALGRKVERELVHNTRVHLLFDLPPAFRNLLPQARIEGQGRCEALTSLSVLPSGEYALCGGAAAGSTRATGLIFGKVGVDPLEWVWRRHPILADLHYGMPDKLEGVCQRCIMKSACQGNCIAENYLRTGSLWSAHWFCETAEKAGLFPAGRLIENRW